MKDKDLWSVRTENCLASKKWWKFLMEKYTASKPQSKALYLCSGGFSAFEKKANGRQSASMNW